MKSIIESNPTPEAVVADSAPSPEVVKEVKRVLKASVQHLPRESVRIKYSRGKQFEFPSIVRRMKEATTADVVGKLLTEFAAYTHASEKTKRRFDRAAKATILALPDAERTLLKNTLAKEVGDEK